jgi:hypothetical protein
MTLWDGLRDEGFFFPCKSKEISKGVMCVELVARKCPLWGELIHLGALSRRLGRKGPSQKKEGKGCSPELPSHSPSPEHFVISLCLSSQWSSPSIPSFFSLLKCFLRSHFAFIPPVPELGLVSHSTPSFSQHDWKYIKQNPFVLSLAN